MTIRRSSYGVLTLTNLSCMVVWPKIVNRIILQGEKVQVSRLLEVLGSRTGIPKGLKKNGKFRRGRGVNDFGIRRALGDEHFGISEGKGV